MPEDPAVHYARRYRQATFLPVMAATSILTRKVLRHALTRLMELDVVDARACFLAVICLLGFYRLGITMEIFCVIGPEIS